MKLSDQSEAEHFVAMLYRVILCREETDPIEVQHFVSDLLNGRSPASIVDEFVGCEEFREKAETRVKLFAPPGHFYSPIVDPTIAHRHLARLEAAEVPTSIPGIMIDRSRMIEVWDSLVPFFQEIPYPPDRSSHYRYAFNNSAYSWGDGSVLHAMLRLHRPRRFIEIGSGWSSACALDTIEHYLDGNCHLTFIEPYPQLLRDLLGEITSVVEIIEEPVQQVPMHVFETLQSGDLLFIDSTHVMSTGSDVCFELFEILTRVPRGVFVHIHDIFWPFEYPRTWAVDDNRSWNEIYAVRAFLTGNYEWQIIFFNDYFSKLERTKIEATYPEFLLNSGGALWLQRS